MQFQVPQFIEVEDKIFGPLTFKQFVYVAGGLGACYLFWKVLPALISAPLIAVTFALAAVLAFFKFNGRPFINGLEHGFYFLIRSKLYLWRNDENGRERMATKKQMLEKQSQAREKSLVHVPNLTDSRLHDLAWSLDIKERIADSEEENVSIGTPARSSHDLT
ncbi:MAG: PrgI family protein [bacterium]|nr:PrgI family protein [bacterium]